MDAIHLPARRRAGYGDLVVRIFVALFAAHWVVSFGEKEGFFELLLMWDYWRSLLISFAIAFLLVTIVYLVTVRLDGKYDWKDHTIPRASLQISLGLIMPAIVAFLVAYFYFAAFGLHILDTPYLKLDFPVIVFMLFVLNVYYLAFYFYRQWRAADQRVQQLSSLNTNASTTKESPTTFTVQQGSQSIPINVTAIVAFYRDGDYNFLKTFDGKTHLISQTLDEIESQADNRQFFRTNRQTIVNYIACKSYVTLEYGKLKIILEPPIHDAIVVSQRKAKAFKEWMTR
jgi:hypothetical protein